MSKKLLSKRRDFLKTAAAGAMGITAIKFDKVFASSSGGWTSGMQVNPAIDNKRVICCHDTKMISNFTSNNSWANQNTMVDANLIASNMDQMAMQLAQKTTAADAWSAIFRSSKPWASTKVAIKINGIGAANGNHPRVAVVKKICDVLVDQLKVPAANIVIYDANTTASGAGGYTSYASLTDSTKIRAVVSVRAASLNGFKAVTITNATKPMSCVADLVDGVIDILVNIAVCKVHDGPGGNYGYGSCSFCMKNHLGTFDNSDALTGTIGDATGLHSIPAICEINKHAAVLGGTPVRQQLCIVDSLLANGRSPGGSWDTRVDRLVMGTFAPIVDYLCAMKILKDVMNFTDRNNNLPKFLTNFDYTEADVQNSWTEFIPGTGVVDPPTREYSGRVVQLALSNPSFKRTVAQFTIPSPADAALHASIFDGRGRLVRRLSASFDETIVWDGLNNNGTTVAAGKYIVKIIAGTVERAGSIIVSR